MIVKVCGITSKEDARMVLDAGADALGVIVDVPVDTPREITIGKALEIKNSLADIDHRFVVVIMPKTVDEAVLVCDRLSPDWIQLHGFERPEFVSELSDKVEAHIIKAIHVEDKVDLEYVKAVSEYADMLLLDTKIDGRVGGTGKTHDYRIDNQLKHVSKKRIILSGGLNPDNVVEAAEAVKPYGVDVSSGVESSPGKKDHRLIKKFIEVTACL